MTVQECTKNFLKKYDVQKLTYEKLEAIVHELGYKIKKFDIYSNRSMEFLDNLGLDEQAKRLKCFTYACKGLNLILVSDSINIKDEKVLILHEIGHIVLNHIIDTKGLVSDNVTQETEANEFVFQVINQLKKRNILKFALNCAFYALILSACCAAIIGGYKLSISSKDGSVDTTVSVSEVVTTTAATTSETSDTTTIVEQPATTTTTSITTTAPVSTTTTNQLTKQDNNDTDVYYITKSGTKYHLASCYHITGRAVTSASKNELESKGYQPCADCIGR